MRVNRQIRAPKVRLIGETGEQIGIVSSYEALDRAQEAGLDLVEISPNAMPPVCKIIDYGKYRYDLTKKEKESKKAQHQIKVKELKFRPNIDENDLKTKIRQMRDFIEKGNKVKVTCMFRGREIAHPENGKRLIELLCDELADIGAPESPAKLFGKALTLVLAPGAAKKKKKEVNGDVHNETNTEE